MKNENKVFAFAIVFLLMAFSVSAAQLPVNLGAARNFSIVAQTTITDATPAASHIIGNIAIEPAAGSFITDTSCMNVVGNIYDNNAGYTGGYDSNVSCKVTDAVETAAVKAAMVTAYNDARGRTGTTVTELGSGNIGGMTLTPGLYKWSSPVTIPTDVTLNCGGNSSAVFIMQMSQTLDISNGKKVILAGSCQPGNIFWQVDTGATLGTTVVFNGNILAGTAITINSGAVLNGRAFAQTAVTLDANNVTLPSCTPSWSCSSFGACQPGDSKACLAVSDANICGQTFGGSLSTYNASCTYGAPVATSNPLGTGGSVGTPQPVATTGGTNAAPAASETPSWLWWILGGIAALALLAWGTAAATKKRR